MQQSQFVFIVLGETTELGVISSVQSFETSLFMAMHNRWVSSVVAVTTSIETLLSYRFGDDRVRSLLELIDMAVEGGAITKSLGSVAHELRRDRNRFTHEKISPKDNSIAAEIFFLKAIPVYHALFKFVTGSEFDVHYGNETLPFVIRKTRYALARNKRSKEFTFSKYSFSVVRKCIANSLMEDIAPVWVTDKISEWFIGRKEMNLKHPLERDQLVQKIFDFNDFPDSKFYDFNDEVQCPAYPCVGSMTLHADKAASASGLFDSIDQATCPNCSLEVWDKMELTEFIIPQLPLEWIENRLQEIGVEYPVEASVKHQIGRIEYMMSFPGNDFDNTSPETIRDVLEHLREVRKAIG